MNIPTWSDMELNQEPEKFFLMINKSFFLYLKSLFFNDRFILVKN